ncbi:MAG TPA: SDR family oxidoreductase [Rhizomicrobium sp.]|nr:SDR family oxidoreductase [Rhizomicrobium sp.]
MNDSFRLDGKVAIVTGSTRGIGLATARLLGQHGAKIAIASRKPEACEAVHNAFSGEGLQSVPIPTHVGVASDIDRLVERTLAAFGRIDVVVANAAINPVSAPMDALPVTSWDKILETNVRSAWLLARTALPAMVAQGGGSVVFVSSTASLMGVPNQGGYAVSKAALNHLARQLAVEWGPKNVRVNVVAPGTTNTDMIRALAAGSDFVAHTISTTPLRRIGEPVDVAATIAFLASEASRQITGQVLVVDGGQCLGGAIGG